MDLLKQLFENAELPSDFKEKTTTLFEAAVAERVKTELSELQESYDKQLEATKIAFVSEAIATVDATLEETILEWAKENAVALDSEIKGQIAESFLQGLKGVFEKADIELSGDTAGRELIKLQEQNAVLTAKAAVSAATLTEAQTQLTKIAIKGILAELTEGLADTQAHRVVKLSEAFDFKSAEDFRAKVALVVEAVGGKIVAVNDNGSGTAQPVPAGGPNVANTVDTSAGIAGSEDGELVKKPAGNSIETAEGKNGAPVKTVAINPLKEQVEALHLEAAPHLHSDLVAETLKLFSKRS